MVFLKYHIKKAK